MTNFIATSNGVTIISTSQPITKQNQFVHTQNSPLSVWTVNHNLGIYPSICVVDSAGHVVEGDVKYNSTNQIVITFSAPFSGYAYCN